MTAPSARPTATDARQPLPHSGLTPGDQLALIDVFLEEVPRMHAALHAAVAQAPLLQALSHELATSFALVGAPHAERQARALESRLRHGEPLNLRAAAAVLLRELDTTVARLRGGQALALP